MDDNQKVHLFNLWNFAFTDNRKTDLFPILLTNTTGTYVEHLNDDCLLEIFSSNSLTPMDLCSLAETCARFKQITQRVFRKDYGIVYDIQYYEFQSKNGTKFRASLQDIERILKNFGSHLTELVICNRNKCLVNLVGMHCGDVTLNHLEMSFFDNIDHAKVHMNSIFQRLQKLTVSSCHFFKGVAFQTNCYSLTELKIRNSSGCVGILEQTFPNLKRFSWHDSHVYTEDSSNATHLYKFAERHGHVKTIDVCDKSICRNGLLHVIDVTCKELENLKVKGCLSSQLSYNFSTEGGLSKLKILDIEFEYANDIALLQAVKLSLETLKLTRWKRLPFQIFDVLPQLQNLLELHIPIYGSNRIPWEMLTRLKIVNLKVGCYAFHRTRLLEMIRQLINLEELELVILVTWKSHILRKEDLAKIVEIVEHRDHLLTLKCNFGFELEENCNENHKVKFIKLKDDYDCRL